MTSQQVRLRTSGTPTAQPGTPDVTYQSLQGPQFAWVRARAVSPEAFAHRVLCRLSLAALAGAMVGVAFAELMLHNLLSATAWGGFVQMEPTFLRVFWAAMGLALGIFLVGIGGLVAAPDPEHDLHACR
ncbi:MAG: hypothetical protein ACYC4R_08800 [Anaerolineae bacterium]